MLEVFFLFLILTTVLAIRMVRRRRRFRDAGVQDPHPMVGWGAAPKKARK